MEKETPEKVKLWNIQLMNDKGKTTNAWVNAPPDDMALAMTRAENAKPGFKAIKAINATKEQVKYWNIQLMNDKGKTTNEWVYAPPDNGALAMKLAENAKPGFKAVKAIN